jgi:hypothetical protein
VIHLFEAIFHQSVDGVFQGSADQFYRDAGVGQHQTTLLLHDNELPSKFLYDP